MNPFQVISRRRRCPLLGSSLLSRASSAPSTTLVTTPSGQNQDELSSTTSHCQSPTFSIHLIRLIKSYFSVKKFVGDLENSLVKNFDSEEKVTAFENVIQDFLLLRKLSSTLQSNPDSFLDNGRTEFDTDIIS